MFTSYFGNLKNISNPLAICGGIPEWFDGPGYRVLAPKYSFFNDYKTGIIDAEGYTEQYNKQVLEPLNPKDIYNYLISKYGEDVTLICYEKSGDFCHRHIVALWFEMNLHVKVTEL